MIDVQGVVRLDLERSSAIAYQKEERCEVRANLADRQARKHMQRRRPASSQIHLHGIYVRRIKFTCSMVSLQASADCHSFVVCYQHLVSQLGK
jgi:hypothetical protein